jgi:hypothetical protein
VRTVGAEERARSGDVWVQGPRQFKDFDEYLVPVEKFTSSKLASALPLAAQRERAVNNVGGPQQDQGEPMS